MAWRYPISAPESRNLFFIRSLFFLKVGSRKIGFSFLVFIHFHLIVVLWNNFGIFLNICYGEENKIWACFTIVYGQEIMLEIGIIFYNLNLAV